MSGGEACKCEEKNKPVLERAWRVLQRLSNRSAFNGGHYTPSDWSAICCLRCRASWRTKATYVYSLKDASPSERYGQ